jgi:succinate dehydrogenase / fumarate reductase, iron-sulfur subunit
VSLLNQQDAEGFGGCTNIGECDAACPAGVPLETISQLNFDLRKNLTGRRPA